MLFLGHIPLSTGSTIENLTNIWWKNCIEKAKPRNNYAFTLRENETKQERVSTIKQKKLQKALETTRSSFYKLKEMQHNACALKCIWKAVLETEGAFKVNNLAIDCKEISWYSGILFIGNTENQKRELGVGRTAIFDSEP